MKHQDWIQNETSTTKVVVEVHGHIFLLGMVTVLGMMTILSMTVVRMSTLPEHVLLHCTTMNYIGIVNKTSLMSTRKDRHADKPTFLEVSPIFN